MHTKKIFSLLFIVAILLLLSSCAAGPNQSVNTKSEKGTIAGFWQGLWHGLICPITFIISLFSDKVNVYEVFNNGGWYNFGFILGAMMTLGGSGRASS